MIDTTKKHILEVYKINIDKYDSYTTKHSMRRNQIVNEYRKAVENNELVIKNHFYNGKEFVYLLDVHVMILQCGKTSIKSWSMRELMYCLPKEVEE